MEWQNQLKQQVLQVFETMLFAIPDEDDESPCVAKTGFAVRFTSPDPAAPPCPDGHLWVGLDEACARDMVSNMLGDFDPSADSIRDGVAEIANVIVGQLFRECAPDAGHDLGTPVAMERPGKDVVVAELDLTFDSGRAAVVISKAA